MKAAGADMQASPMGERANEAESSPGVDLDLTAAQLGAVVAVVLVVVVVFLSMLA